MLQESIVAARISDARYGWYIAGSASRRESKLTFDCGGKETDQGELRQPSMAIRLGLKYPKSMETPSGKSNSRMLLALFIGRYVSTWRCHRTSLRNGHSQSVDELVAKRFMFSSAGWFPPLHAGPDAFAELFRNRAVTVLVSVGTVTAALTARSMLCSFDVLHLEHHAAQLHTLTRSKFVSSVDARTTWCT